MNNSSSSTISTPCHQLDDVAHHRVLPDRRRLDGPHPRRRSGRKLWFTTDTRSPRSSSKPTASRTSVLMRAIWSSVSGVSRDLALGIGGAQVVDQHRHGQALQAARRRARIGHRAVDLVVARSLLRAVVGFGGASPAAAAAACALAGRCTRRQRRATLRRLVGQRARHPPRAGARAAEFPRWSARCARPGCPGLYCSRASSVEDISIVRHHLRHARGPARAAASAATRCAASNHSSMRRASSICCLMRGEVAVLLRRRQQAALAVHHGHLVRRRAPECWRPRDSRWSPPARDPAARPAAQLQEDRGADRPAVAHEGRLLRHCQMHARPLHGLQAGRWCAPARRSSACW